MLFDGVKLWIAHRVPMRSHYAKLVKDNGGEVVPLEKQAEYLIWDHLRKDAPAGALSWTYIDQSFKKGELENPNNHICGPPAGSVREASSSRPSHNKTREPYTAEDDRILYKWGRNAELQNVSVKGNEIWKQLEAKNPRHPWQSWRDRWVKRVSLNPPPAGWEDAAIELLGDQEGPKFQPAKKRENTVEVVVPAPPKPCQPPAARMKSVPSSANQRQTSQPHGRSTSGAIVHKNALQRQQQAVGAGINMGRQPLLHTNGIESEIQPATAMREATPPVQPNTELTPQSTPNRPRRDVAVESTPSAFTTEDFLTVFENIDSIMSVNLAQFMDAWERWAAETPYTSKEWREFFLEQIMPVYDSVKEDGIAGQRMVLECLHRWIIDNPMQPFPGWKEIGGEEIVMFAPSTSKKRSRDDESVFDSPSKSVAANIKRHRVERTVQITADAEFEEIHEEISETIETNETMIAEQTEDTIDLTALTDTSPSSDLGADGDHEEDSEEEQVQVPVSSDRNPQAQVVCKVCRVVVNGKDEDRLLRHRKTKKHLERVREKLEKIQNGEDLEDGNESQIEEEVDDYYDDSDDDEDMINDTRPPNEEIDNVEASVPMETQAILAAETQAVDFDILEPEDGFVESGEEEGQDIQEPKEEEEELLQESEDEEEQFMQNQEQGDQDLIDQQLQYEALNTQNLNLDSLDTQDLEDETLLTIPEPAGGFDETQTSGTQSTADLTEDETPTEGSDTEYEDIFEGWAERRISEGFPVQDIATAAHCTSLNTRNLGLLDSVLVSLKSGRGIPSDVRGIWTKEDDEYLQGADARLIRKVEEKHGNKGIVGWRTRSRFLEKKIEGMPTEEILGR